MLQDDFSVYYDLKYLSLFEGSTSTIKSKKNELRCLQQMQTYDPKTADK